tara:strand:- start:3801 stop:4340 length:540 start_codon:yes stop_codon:yes gene_type:complete
MTKIINDIDYRTARNLGLVHSFKRTINSYVGLNALEDLKKGKNIVDKYGLRDDGSSGILYDFERVHDIGKIPSFITGITLGFLNDDEGNAFLEYSNPFSVNVQKFKKGEEKLQNLLEDSDYRNSVENYLSSLIAIETKKKKDGIKLYADLNEYDKVEIFESALDRFVQYRDNFVNTCGG